ncbi:site-specific integrase [Kitasatospora sp. NBC_00240]|uniref:tyrosine-type recombinase/integrase n=1 Tax=Kitasatospora sp. NBC_00240 TaxID=2903567 RepID=UPI00225A7D1A|nr:tyrosine-type recombinase/integrase [Kitasatospora sp. NBC_00240]MCX5215903.1 site-specific integrase [Kitasatospora sp. NBC_00240]
MRNPAFVQVTGPLAPFAEGFRVRLEVLGYARQPQVVHLDLMARLSRWLDERGLDGSALSTEAVEEFVLDRQVAGHRSARSIRSLRPLVEYLREIGAAPLAVRQPVAGPVEVLLADYAVHLARERGLAAVTIQRSTDLVRPFLAARVCAAGLDLKTLSAADVIAFMLARSGSASPATVQRTGTALRALLRFLHLQGLIDNSLVGAVPTAANWKLAALPKYLTREQVATLLHSCDRGTAVGRRDLAILTLLARLGLRAGEVAALRLEDIDWQRGEITVRGKGNRHERLPLPTDVGEAVVAYLSGSRPAAATGREVFVGTRAPHRALTRGAVTQLVARASHRCGLGTIYAHRLRHTAATAMLHAGASLEEIGQVLRHRHALTTAGYAKVDHEGLRALARPWPGEAA